MNNKKTSFRSVGMRNINALSAPISRIKALRDDEVRRGFTLIELLVVVLIIGILAAIALPQYQKAVLKSRYSSLVPLAKALRDGNEAYYLTNGNYADDKSKLDVTTNDPKAEVTLGNEEAHKYVRVTRADIHNRITMYQKHSVNFPSETHCEAEINNSQANWLCKDALKGTFIGNKYGYAVYSLNDNWEGSLDRKYMNFRGNATFTDGDVCEATVGYNCRGDKWAEKLTFENGATCVATSGWGSCSGENIFNSGAVCIGNTKWACEQGKFDNSYCVGERGWANPGESTCRRGTFNNYSVCYANAANTCTGDYDSTSCCVGGSNCPEGTRCEDKLSESDLSNIPAQPTYP